MTLYTRVIQFVLYKMTSVDDVLLYQGVGRETVISRTKVP